MKTAVIGTGAICREHMIGLRAVPGIDLVGVCDLSPALAEFAAGRFGARAAFSDHRRMLDAAEPEVVHVLTPPATHPALVADCLQAGAHVIVEKPVAPTHGEFTRLWRLACQQRRQLIEDHNYRFNRPVCRMTELIAGGGLGSVEEVDIRIALNLHDKGSRYADANLPHGSHRLPAGVVHEFITHMAYLAVHLLPAGGDQGFDRIAAAWSNHRGDDLFKYDDLDALVIRGRAHVRLRFSANTGPAAFGIVVRGSAGLVEADLFHPYFRAVLPRRPAQLSPIVNHLAGAQALVRATVGGLADKLRQRTAYEGLYRLIAETYRALETKSDMPVRFEDIDAASRLVDAVLDPANRL